ncbi:MAG: hypothetical protein IKM24_04120 [Clostridia bacterium]|nr:hypothetical protein [Clostridia bacterium]
MKKIIDYYRSLPKNEWREMRKSVSVPEYVLWWQVRVMMLYALGMTLKTYLETGEKLDILIQLIANVFAAFSVTFFRVVFPKQIFLGRLPYSAQKYGMILVLFGSYMGHYLGFCGKPGYDSFLHVLSGFLCVFICHEAVVKCLQKQERPLSGFMSSVVGFGMGCFVIIFWEIFEFVYDYFVGTTLQDFLFNPSEDYILFRLFGTPAAPEQKAVFDTMIDMVLALVSSIPAAAILWASTAHKQKKQAQSEPLQFSQPPQIESQEAMKK